MRMAPSFSILIIILLISVVFVEKLHPKPFLETRCGQKTVGVGNVYGGKLVEANSWPWLVAFMKEPENTFFCGGSYVSKRFIVSGK